LEYGGARLPDGLLQRLALGPVSGGIRLTGGEVAAAFEVLAAALVFGTLWAVLAHLRRRRRRGR
jgi:hypothetical protein